MKEVDPRQAENVEGDPEKEIVKEDAEEIDQGKFNEILRQDLYFKARSSSLRCSTLTLLSFISEHQTMRKVHNVVETEKRGM